jgi:hypothetical protein
MLAIGVYLGTMIGGTPSGSKRETLAKLNNVLNLIDEKYVDDVDRNKLVDDAIISLMKNLDPHSYYMTAEEASQAHEELSGSFGGVGIQFMVYRDTLIVTHLIPGGPAEEVGIKVFDRIIKVDKTTFAGRTITTGSTSTYIGASCGASAAGVSGEVVLGSYNMTGKGVNTVFCSGGNGSSYNGANTTTWATISDQRLKKNIVDNNIGLEKITAIQVRNFEYRLPEEITEVPQDQAIKKSGTQLGVIAQELQQVLPECVKTESTGVMSVDADNLTWYMINAIKELKQEVDSLKQQLALR